MAVDYERRGMRDYPSAGEETRTRIELPWLRGFMFPANLVANMISNGIAGLIRPFSRSCCIAVPFEFLEGTFIFGPRDAAWSIWQPTELDPRSIDWEWRSCSD
jgi:hypothetical protein